MTSTKVCLLLSMLGFLTVYTRAQDPANMSSAKVIVCDEDAGCTHQFINGHKFKILSEDGVTVTASLIEIGKYIRADVSVFNGTTKAVDVLPTHFECDEVAPKERTLVYVDAEKIIRSAQTRVAWGNAFTAMGANMSRQQSTTNTNSTGNVNMNGSDGTYANGTYSGTSTSTTSTPNYAAQARAKETIRRRNATIETLSEQYSQEVLKANTVIPNQTIRGFVFFERDKKAETISLSVPVGGTLFKFPFVFVQK